MAISSRKYTKYAGNRLKYCKILSTGGFCAEFQQKHVRGDRRGRVYNHRPSELSGGGWFVSGHSRPSQWIRHDKHSISRNYLWSLLFLVFFCYFAMSPGVSKYRKLLRYSMCNSLGSHQTRPRIPLFATFWNSKKQLLCWDRRGFRFQWVAQLQKRWWCGNMDFPNKIMALALALFWESAAIKCTNWGFWWMFVVQTRISSRFFQLAQKVCSAVSSGDFYWDVSFEVGFCAYWWGFVSLGLGASSSTTCCVESAGWHLFLGVKWCLQVDFPLRMPWRKSGIWWYLVASLWLMTSSIKSRALHVHCQHNQDFDACSPLFWTFYIMVIHFQLGQFDVEQSSCGLHYAPST